MPTFKLQAKDQKSLVIRFHTKIRLLLCGALLMPLLVHTSVAQDFPWKSKTSPLIKLRLYAEFDRPRLFAGQVAVLTLRGTIADGWHIYSVQKQGEDGPSPTSLTFESGVYQTDGPLRESSPQDMRDEALGLKLAVHQGAFILTQQFRIVPETKKGVHDFHGQLNYQICDNNICAPLQQQQFSAPLEVITPQ
ncbi:protein-disulfide reductase DsbD domain-containing protein [Deltaproteobacteria bacterium TL4]